MAAPIPPEVKKIVTFIFLADAQGNLLQDQNKNPAPNGTGFFVGVTNDAKTGGYGYLVTAKHVLRDAQGKNFPRIYLRLDKLKGNAEFIPLDLVYDGNKRNVFTHTDPTVDIAVIPCLPPQIVFDFKILPDDFLTTKQSFQELEIGEGTDVFFTGLFVAHYGERQNVPIVRFGRVAMVTDDRILWGNPPQPTELYLLETQSYGGNSGSPVFFYLGSDRSPGNLIVGPPVIKLAGIMSGRFNDTQPPIRMIQTENSVPISMPNMGIAGVTPSYLLHDILFSDELKKLRADNPIPTPLK